MRFFIVRGVKIGAQYHKTAPNILTKKLDLVVLY